MFDRNLSEFERDMQALADMPEYEKNFILSNGPEVAPCINEIENEGRGQGLPDFEFFRCGDGAQDGLELRDMLRSEVFRRFPRVRWETLGLRKKGYWSYRMSMRAVIKELAGIRDTDFTPYREHNFLRCGSRTGGAVIYEYADGQKRLEISRCSESTSCPDCADHKAKEVSGDIFEYFWAIHKANPADVKRAWFYVFTLPSRLEAEPEKGSEARKVMTDGLKRLVRKFHGLKTRDMLPAYCSTHAVGGSDVFRTRFHFHVGVLPFAVHRPKGQAETVGPADFDGELAPVDEMRRGWLKVLQKVYPDVTLDEVNCRAEYVPLNEEHKGKLRHRLNYDMRGFGSDFTEQAVIYHCQSHGILTAGKGQYQLRTMRDIASRWLWVRRQRSLQVWGPLKVKDAYAAKMGIGLASETPPEEIGKVDVQIERECGRAYDKDKCRVVWVDGLKVFDMAGSLLPTPEIGRLCEREFWWPLTEPFPPDTKCRWLEKTQLRRKSA